MRMKIELCGNGEVITESERKCIEATISVMNLHLKNNRIEEARETAERLAKFLFLIEQAYNENIVLLNAEEVNGEE